MCKAYKLVHRPTRRFLELRDVIFDEGGRSSRIECVTIEHNSAPSSATQTQTQTPQTLPLPPPPLQPTQPANPPDLPAPTVTAMCPRRNIRAPVRDDHSCYNVSSYRLRPCAEHASFTPVIMCSVTNLVRRASHICLLGHRCWAKKFQRA